MGNKGANLVTMTQLDLPVPAGFIISNDAFHHWEQTGLLPLDEIKQNLTRLEIETNSKLGRGLEVSVRSSAAVSMPGMMDTVLNVGEYDLLIKAVKRIFESWNNNRALEYRRINNIENGIGTAAVIQAMVYGNRDESSGTGVVFSRNPSTGEKELFGEYLKKAQGEALVSGENTPSPVNKLKQEMPAIYLEIEQISQRLEKHFRDMQDIEFTVDSGKLYILQTRSGKRSGHAAVKIAVDFVTEGLITRDEALMRISVDDIRGLLHKRIKQPQSCQAIIRGLAAAPGATGGIVAFDTTEALRKSKKGNQIILVREETSPDDIQGMAAAAGILTRRGGITSHAAIVARGMGKPCVTGAENIEIDMRNRSFSCNGRVIREGEEITIDGTSGNIYPGLLALEENSLPVEMGQLMSWADGFKRLGVRANADSPEAIRQSRVFGAEGIGLCRTERMFNAPSRLSVIREFILAENDGQRKQSLEKLKKLQTADFADLFRELDGMPIIIRLLDLPLHEFLPPSNEVKDASIKQRILELVEVNPMLGHRGVRLAITLPEIYSMQIQAIEEAVKQMPADVAIMIPQVVTAQEVLFVKKLMGASKIKFGVMMETVRACMRAGHLAEQVDFFSFGTNDLTQAVFSFSREDAEKKFLSTYLDRGILQTNPFEILDTKGVGRLMETAIFWARRARNHIEIGVCGEHAGEPHSIGYLHTTGVDYVSCSPFRVPIAKLVAAQAALASRSTVPEILGVA